MFAAIAQLARRRHWAVIAVAVIAGAVAGLLGGPVAGYLKGGGFSDPGSEAAHAGARMEQASGVSVSDNLVALVRPGAPVASADGRAELEQVVSKLQADPAVAAVTDALTTPSPALVSRDGMSTYVVAGFRSGADAEAAVKRIESAFAADRHVTLGGQTIAVDQVSDQVSADLARAEMFAFPILFVLLLLVFRGLVAALLPLVMGGLTIVLAFLELRGVTLRADVSLYALNLITGAGLGLSIDYSLLMVSRFREELDRTGGDVAASLRRTVMTAGRTVLFSSITVAAAIASLMLFPERFLWSMGVGGVLVVLSGAAVALLVLPALLAALGTRVDSLALRPRPRTDDTHGAWYRIAGLVMRRPVAITLVTVAALVALGFPFLGIRFTSVDASVLPVTASARQVSDALGRDFPNGGPSNVEIVVSAPQSAAADVAALGHAVSAVPGIAAVAPPRPLDASTWEIAATESGGTLSDTSQSAIRTIRAPPSSHPFQVAGDTADFLDLQSSLAAHIPAALLIIAATTFAVLFAATGSVVLPVKSLIMNVATISATFGILVLIFQDGRLQSLLGYTSQGALESTQPILLVALAFGLSTDYGVFLLTRIREAHDAGMPTREAVSHGLQRTGRIVTAAAVCFCVAIGAFASSEIVFIKELGLGTALAVLIDATIVRALLVPSLMALLGDWNWWSPRPLRALHHALRLDRMDAPESAAQHHVAA